MEKDTGYASAGLGSNHPSVKMRKDEILKIRDELCQEEIEIACLQFSEKKWHRLQLNEKQAKDENFAASKESLKIIEK